MAKPRPSKELQAEWDLKLKESGFDDIETADGKLKMWSQRWNTDAYKQTIPARQEYYYMANQFLNTYPFDSEFDRIIWQYHCDAVGVRDIAATLNALGIYEKTDRTRVNRVVQRYREIMKRIYLK